MPDQSSVLDGLRRAALASRRAKGPKCRVCCLQSSVLEAVHTLRLRDGMQFTDLAAALNAEGHGGAERFHPFNLSNHFRERHHEREG